jgi:hypothetical protein
MIITGLIFIIIGLVLFILSILLMLNHSRKQPRRAYHISIARQTITEVQDIKPQLKLERIKLR